MLELDDLHRRFGDVQALRGLTFEVRPGELCGFLGPNGAGKTTAMRAVLGLVRLDRGEVRWRGHPIDARTRQATGYLPEERGLYPRMRVAEQIVYFGRLHGLDRRTARVRTQALLDELDLGDRAEVDTETLSLGNQQRVQLAAALVHRPPLLVLDEPFSGLDPLAVETMSDALRRHADTGAAVVVSSHQLDLVEDLCDTVAIVTQGRTVRRGRVAQLREAGGRRLRLLLDGPAGWAADPPAGVTVERCDAAPDGPTHLLLALDEHVDPATVLDLARTEAHLREVSLGTPRLSELFRDAVTTS